MLKKCLILVVAASMLAVTVDLVAEEEIDADWGHRRPRMEGRGFDEDLPRGRGGRQRGRADFDQADVKDMREAWLDELTEAYRENDDEKVGRLIRRMNQAKQRIGQRGRDLDRSEFDGPRGRQRGMAVQGRREGIREGGKGRAQREPMRGAKAMQGGRGAKGAGRGFAAGQGRMRRAGGGGDFGPMHGGMAMRGGAGAMGPGRGIAAGQGRMRRAGGSGQRRGAAVDGFRGRGKAGRGINIRQGRQCPECGSGAERVRGRQGQFRQMRGRRGGMNAERGSAGYGWGSMQRRRFGR